MVDDLKVMRGRISNHSCYTNQRKLVYLDMVLADKLIVQGDVVMAEEELKTCIMHLTNWEEGSAEKDIKLKFLLMKKIKFLQFEVAVLSRKYSRETSELALQISSLVDPDTAPHFSYLCYSAGAELLRLDRQEEAMDWLNSVLQVDKQYKITEIRDATVKLMIGIVKMREEEPDDKLRGFLENLVEMISSHQDKLLLKLDLAKYSLLSHPYLPPNLVLSHSYILDLVTMSHTSPMKEEILEWLLSCPWKDFSPSQKEDCLAKIIYTGRNLVEGPAHVALMKYIELVTAEGPDLGKSVGMVLEIGDQAVIVLGMEDKLGKMEEWLKALSFLSSMTGKADFINHFAESFLVLLLKQERYTEAVSYLELWRKAAPGYSVIREQLELTVFLITGNNSGAVELLRRTLMVEHMGCKEEEVGQSLRLLMFDLVDREKVDLGTVEQLIMGLADRKFFFSIDLLQFAVKLVVNMKRYQLLATMLSRGKVKDWLVGEDDDLFLSKLCWDLGLSSGSLELKHSLLCLSGQLLGPADIAGQAARLASVPAGLAALEKMEGKGFELLVSQLEEELFSLEEEVTSWGMKRTLLLYQFKLYLLNGKKEGMLDNVVEKIAKLGDINGLEAVSLMGARLEKFTHDQVAVKALMEGQKLDKSATTREKRAVLILEIMSRKPDWWRNDKVVKVVKSVDWTVGLMLSEAIKMVWNSWVVVVRKKECKEPGWGKALVWLHNLGTDVVDHITCKLEQPTITLLRKVRRVARGHIVQE